MWMSGPWPWMWIFPLICLVVMLLAVFLIFGRGGLRPPCGGWTTRGGAPSEQEPDSPMEILKRRYAKGEITKEEFDRIKGDLH